MGDVEIRGYSKAATEIAQFPLIERLSLKTRSNLLYGVMVFTKASIQAASRLFSFESSLPMLPAEKPLSPTSVAIS